MSFFSNLEKSLENLIERALLGKSGGRVQPIEIARAMWQEITCNKRVSVKHTYVPNFFHLTLSLKDFEYLKSIRASMEAEILEHLARESEKRDFHFLGPLVIQWKEDPKVGDKGFCISSDFLEESEMPSDIRLTEKAKKVEEKSGWKPDIRSSQEVPERLDETLFRSILKVVDGLDKGKVFVLLDKREYVIGRDEACDIVIGDPRISRRHAKIYFNGAKFCLEDIDSKTGIYVNGKKVEKALLEGNEEIGLGMTMLKFKR
jgi:hypothetical protein